VTGVDFADADRGLSAALRSGAAVIFDHEDVLVAEPHAPLELEVAGEGSERAAVPLRAGELELELAAVGHAIRLGGELVPDETLSACRVSGSLRGEGDAVEFASLGVRSQAAETVWSRVERLRSLAVVFSDGALLALSAALPRGAGGHGEEELAAALVEPESGPLPIREALLSTQYDPEGRHRRATLELWPEGEAEPPLRAGGSIVCGASLPLGELRLDTAFFRWSMDGRPGLGRYEILSAT
jgi:hypothetical protein